jgi:hypothetical protein
VAQGPRGCWDSIGWSSVCTGTGRPEQKADDDERDDPVIVKMPSIAEENKFQNSATDIDRQIAASISRQGVGIGQCLFDALKNLEPSGGATVDDDEVLPAAKKRKIRIDPGAVDRIMQTFGEAVADTQLESTTTKSATSAPRALLRGRLDHYNRVGQNWRMVIDNVKLKERFPLRSDRKKRNKNIIWDGTREKREEIAIDEKVQILAYNDV